MMFLVSMQVRVPQRSVQHISSDRLKFTRINLVAIKRRSRSLFMPLKCSRTFVVTISVVRYTYLGRRIMETIWRSIKEGQGKEE